MATVEEIRTSLQHLDWTGYIVLVLMLIVCLLIGLYFSCKKQSGSEAVNFLLGGLNLKIFPVSMSLIASGISGVGLLGTSTEIYLYGFHYIFWAVAIIPAALLMHFFILPVFHRLKFVSLFEYLEKRFNKSLRLLASVLFLFNTVTKIPIVIYMAVVTLEQITGIGIYATTPLICVICIIYTCIGGLRGVIWTDVVQSFLMLGALVIVAVKTTYSLGGVGIVIERNLNSTRLETPIVNIDPTIRISFWSAFVGSCIHLLAFVNLEQSMLQRYIALPTLRQARQALWIFAPGFALITVFAIYNGFLVYAKYYDCDPLSTGLVTHKDQLISFLVTDSLQHFPFLRGCFVAGALSASLSTVSTLFNSVSAVIFEDFVKLRYGNRLSERATGYIIRATIVVVGVITTAMVFLVSKLGTVIVVAVNLAGMLNGPLLGLFITGLTMPWIGGKSALFGTVSGIIVMLGVLIKTQLDVFAGVLSYETKPLTTEGCLYSFNSTTQVAQIESEKSFYHISFLNLTLAGAVVTVLFANLFSPIFKKKTPVDLDLLTPCIRELYRKQVELQIPLSVMTRSNNDTEVTYKAAVASDKT